MKQILIGAVVSAIVAILAILGFSASNGTSIPETLGKVSRAFDVDMQVLSLQLATSSDAVTRDGSNWKINGIGEGSCNLSQSSPGSHAATSSKEYYCAFTGARSGDTVNVVLPPGAGLYTSGAQSLFGGFAVVSAYATTSDRIGVLIANNTGAATSSAIQATTSARVLIVR